MTVKTVTEKVNSKGDKNAILSMEDGRQIWTPEYDKALPLLGKPIPADWYQDEGQYGPRAFPPRAKGSGGGGGGSKMASWYNSEAGVKFTQERMDRRTALMQATSSTIVGPDDGGSVVIMTDAPSVIERAELYYDWLRESSVPASALGKGQVGTAEGPVGATAGVSSPSPAPTGSTNEYPADWPVETR